MELGDEILIFEAFKGLTEEEQDEIVAAGAQIMSKTTLDVYEAIEVLYKLGRYMNKNPREIR